MPEARQSVPAEREKVAGDRAIAALAAQQHGVITRGQLLDVGVSSSAIGRWIERGRLQPLHRGVYAVGHRRLRREGFWLAAVLAAGPGALLSHREAAALHKLRPAWRTSIDVTAAARRRVPGIQVHRVERLHDEDATTVDGIPVTSVARTLVDLATVVPPAALRKALEEAERSHRLDVAAIDAALCRTRGRNRGHAAMRHALAALARAGTTRTASELEDRFRALVEAHRLSRPQTNVWLGTMEVDVCWPRERLVVELDGWGPHSTRRAFQRDRTRSNDLQAAGWAVLRFTHDDVVHRPADTAARIARALAQAAATSG